MKTLAASVLGLTLLFATTSAHADRVVVGRPGVVVRGGFGPRVGVGVGYVGPRAVVPGPYYGYAPAPIYVGPRAWGPRWGGPRYFGRPGFRAGWRR